MFIQRLCYCHMKLKQIPFVMGASVWGTYVHPPLINRCTLVLMAQHLMYTGITLNKPQNKMKLANFYYAFGMRTEHIFIYVFYEQISGRSFF